MNPFYQPPYNNYNDNFYQYSHYAIKPRKRTSKFQKDVLESVFSKTTKPDTPLRKKLAENLQMTPREVQIWFQNRRAKEKKNKTIAPQTRNEIKKHSSQIEGIEMQKIGFEDGKIKKQINKEFDKNTPSFLEWQKARINSKTEQSDDVKKENLLFDENEDYFDD